MCMSSYISIKLRLLFPRASYASLVLSLFLRLHVIQAVLYFRENIIFFFMPMTHITLLNPGTQPNIYILINYYCRYYVCTLQVLLD